MPTVLSLNPDVGVTEGYFSPLPLPDADKTKREPDHSRVTEGPHREVFLRGRFDLLVEFGSQGQLTRFVAAAAVADGVPADVKMLNAAAEQR